MPELSIIIPTKKPRDKISAVRALEADNSAEYEVLIRDDEGAATARNRAVKMAKTYKLVFLDDDSHPQPGYLARVADLLDEYAIVAGRVVDPGEDYFARMAENHDYDQGNEFKSTDTLVGCNFAARREVFEAVGGFDEKIEWGHEDTMFAAQAAEDFDIYYDPDLVVEHRFCETATEFWRKQWQFGRADVYRARVRNESVFSNWYEVVPISGDSTIKGIAVKSIGKSLRISRKLVGIFDDRVLRLRDKSDLEV